MKSQKHTIQCYWEAVQCGKSILSISILNLFFALAISCITASAFAQELPRKEHPLPSDNISIELVRIPAGSFNMGSNFQRFDEAPVHEVQITKDFYIAETEVTVKQFRAFVEATGYKTTAEIKGICSLQEQPARNSAGKSWKKPGFVQNDDHPVTCITWIDAMEFVKWAGGRLPTEAEWEYAARAGTEGDYAGDVEEMAWYMKNSNDITHPVAQKKPNAWGLFDMHGNVWEWVSDWWSGTYYPISPSSDPTGPARSSQIRAFRGGSWAENAANLRSSKRNGTKIDIALNEVGFRMVVEVETSNQ